MNHGIGINHANQVVTLPNFVNQRLVPDWPIELVFPIYNKGNLVFIAPILPRLNGIFGVIGILNLRAFRVASDHVN
jgi:hypothetical protein